MEIPLNNSAFKNKITLTTKNVNYFLKKLLWSCTASNLFCEGLERSYGITLIWDFNSWRKTTGLSRILSKCRYDH